MSYSAYQLRVDDPMLFDVLADPEQRLIVIPRMLGEGIVSTMSAVLHVHPKAIITASTGLAAQNFGIQMEAVFRRMPEARAAEARQRLLPIPTVQRALFRKEGRSWVPKNPTGQEPVFIYTASRINSIFAAQLLASGRKLILPVDGQYIRQLYQRWGLKPPTEPTPRHKQHPQISQATSSL